MASRTDSNTFLYRSVGASVKRSATVPVVACPDCASADPPEPPQAVTKTAAVSDTMIARNTAIILILVMMFPAD